MLHTNSPASLNKWCRIYLSNNIDVVKTYRVMLNEVKHLAKSPAESTERSFTCFEISPPYSRRNDKNMISFSTHFQIRRYIQTCC